VGLAGLLKDRANGGQRVGTVLTGGNVNSEVFGEVLCSVALGKVTKEC
jgi:threonine dehydratase